MKQILYFLLAAGALLLTACQDITVGYLMTEHGAYTIDSLVIVKIDDRIAEIEGQLRTIDETGAELNRQLAELEEKADKAYADGMAIQRTPEYVEADEKYFDAFISGNTTEAAKWKAILDKLDEQVDVFVEQYREFQRQIEEIELKLEDIAGVLGFPSPLILKNELSDWQDRLTYKIPWVVPAIDGVDGTEPMIWSLVSVGSEDTAEAEKFTDCLRVLGGGGMNVEYDVAHKVAPGRYTVSLRVENEGRSAVLPQIFTFIIR